MARKNPSIDDVTVLSAAFIRWGLGLFIFSLIAGYGPFVHFLFGALDGYGGPPFKDVVLWLGSPLAAQIGALGMVAIGAVYGLLPADKLDVELRDYAALWLCVIGLIAIVVVGYLGYYALNTIGRSFYEGQRVRENVWLIGLGLSGAIYVVGVALAYISILHVTDCKIRRS